MKVSALHNGRLRVGARGVCNEASEVIIKSLCVGLELLR